jgi:2-polyprenyl-3-methyl-5-hydroxy-6-metoxy-1,4-benzoquinol methylase
MKRYSNVKVYREFAQLYTSGKFTEFSARMAQLLPSLLDQYKMKPETILDVACGEGTFAIAMTKAGFKVTGIDQSPKMLEIARKKARAEGVIITFHEMDMRQLELKTTFDLVTCWFDSLNYLLAIDDLTSTFNGVAQHLNPGGYFIFDMNTIFWLTTLAHRYTVTLEHETEDIFQVHRHSYDEETRIATFEITGFIKDNGCWKRQFDETHHERGYNIDEIRSCLNKAGLSEIACYGNLEEGLQYTPESKRVWFITKK